MIGLLSILVLCTLCGCTPWHSFIDDLNTRQVQSCIKWTGSAAPYMSVQGITATGGVNLKDCDRYL